MTAFITTLSGAIAIASVAESNDATDDTVESCAASTTAMRDVKKCSTYC